MTTKIAAPLGALFCMAAFMATAGETAYAAECKALEKTACERRAECTYVGTYTRKDGTSVSGHCKRKPKSSQSTKSKDKLAS